MRGPATITWSWTNPKVRALGYQAALLASVAFVLWLLASTTWANLQRQHIASGFAFLGHTAGFGIVQTLIPYSEAASYGRVFLVGLANTLLVAALGTGFATVLGFVIGLARLSRNWLVAKLAIVYVETLRNIPLLLQLFFWYFAILRPLPGPRESLMLLPGVFLNNRGVVLPKPEPGPSFVAFGAALAIAIAVAMVIRRWGLARQARTGVMWPTGTAAAALVIGLPLLVCLVAGAPFVLERPLLGNFDFVGGWRLLPEFVALVIGLSVYTAAFIAEIVRAGIRSVNPGQTEAAYALGIPAGATLRLVVIPQALRVIIPPLTSQILNLTKNSSLAVAIAYPDLVSVFAGTVLNQTGQAIEVVSITMAVYLAISLLTSLAMNIYNARVVIGKR